MNEIDRYFCFIRVYSNVLRVIVRKMYVWQDSESVEENKVGKRDRDVGVGRGICYYRQGVRGRFYWGVEEEGLSYYLWWK